MNYRFLPYLLMLAMMNSCIELEISVPSFINLMRDLKINESLVGLTITSNLIGFCIASLIWGPLSDAFGRRYIMILGNGILVLGGFGCVCAPSIKWLLVARFIQGLGGATSAVVVSAIISDIYSMERASKLYGVMNAVFTISMAIAPLIGGGINKYVGWRGNYGFVAVVCLISWLCLCLFLKETKEVNASFNMRSTFKHYKKLFSHFHFLSAAVVPSLLYACYVSFVSVSSFLYRESFQLTSAAYTTHLSLVVTTFAFASFLSSCIKNQYKEKKIFKIAIAAVVISGINVFWANHPIILTLGMCLFSMGFAFIYPIVFSYSIEIFSPIKGTASSLIMSIRYALCSVLNACVVHAFDQTTNSLACVIIFASVIIVVLIKDIYSRVFAS